MHFRLLTFETQVAIGTTIALVLLAVSLPLAFKSERAALWWLVKISTGVAALGAIILIVVNIGMTG